MFFCAQMRYCQMDVAVNCLKINHPHLNVMFLLRFSRNRFRRLDTPPAKLLWLKKGRVLSPHGDVHMLSLPLLNLFTVEAQTPAANLFSITSEDSWLNEPHTVRPCTITPLPPNTCHCHHHTNVQLDLFAENCNETGHFKNRI